MINKLFEEKIIDEMNLKEAQKEMLRKKQRKDKVFLLTQKLKSQSKSMYKSPADYVHYLEKDSTPNSIHSKELSDCVKSLKIELRGNTVSWVRDFGDNRGHIFILQIIRLCSQLKQSDRKPHELISDCVQCLQSFMNNTVGFNLIFEYDQAFVILVNSLDPKLPQIMCKTLELLAAVTLVEHGVERVLNAFTDAAIDSGRHDGRFWIIIEGLKMWRTKNISTAIASIQLLNCLITNHDEFEQRLHLRNEIYRTSDFDGKRDFRTIISEVEQDRLFQEMEQKEREQKEMERKTDRLSAEPDVVENEMAQQQAASTLQTELTMMTRIVGRPLSASNSINSLVSTNFPTQTNQSAQSLLLNQLPPEKRFFKFFILFFQSRDEDFDEIANRFENIRFDFDNMDDCYKVLRQTVVSTPCEPYLLSILQLLLYIRDDPLVK